MGQSGHENHTNKNGCPKKSCLSECQLTLNEYHASDRSFAYRKKGQPAVHHNLFVNALCLKSYNNALQTYCFVYVCVFLQTYYVVHVCSVFYKLIILYFF